MTYFECTECGELAHFVHLDRRSFHAACPVCETETLWEIAFVDNERGVSF